MTLIIEATPLDSGSSYSAQPVIQLHWLTQNRKRAILLMAALSITGCQVAPYRNYPGYYPYGYNRNYNRYYVYSPSYVDLGSYNQQYNPPPSYPNPDSQSSSLTRDLAVGVGGNAIYDAGKTVFKRDAEVAATTAIEERTAARALAAEAERAAAASAAASAAARAAAAEAAEAAAARAAAAAAARAAAARAAGMGLLRLLGLVAVL